jgi:tRNA(fMet)-specific endonuclease VapC
MRYLLDASSRSDIVRQPAGRVAQHVQVVGEGLVCTSIIVAAEMRFGAAKLGSARLSGQLEAVLQTFEILSLKAPADTTYGLIRAQLDRAGTPIGANDLFIAAHTMALGLTLVTNNEREFSRVEGLKIENWLWPV